MGFQQVQLHGVQLRWDSDPNTDTYSYSHDHADAFECFGIAFGYTGQHSNSRHGDIYHFYAGCGINGCHGDLHNEWDSDHGFELLA